MLNKSRFKITTVQTNRTHPLHEVKYLVISFGVVQFIVVTLVAALLYPSGYDFIAYYLSDLGTTMTRTGEANTLSSWLFTLTLIVIAITLIPFWISVSSEFRESKLETVVSRFGSTLGVLSSPFMIGVALTPMDTHLTLHFTMFLVFFPLFIAASFLHSCLIVRSQRYQSRIGIFGLGLFMLDVIVLINPLVSYGALLQKVLLYGHFIWVLALTHLVKDIKHETRARIDGGSQQLANSEAWSFNIVEQSVLKHSIIYET
jgi:hypothetical protein